MKSGRRMRRKRSWACGARSRRSMRSIAKSSLLREYEGLSYEEIAAALRIPVNTVRSRLFRARMALKELLDPQPQKLRCETQTTAGAGIEAGTMNRTAHEIEPEEVMAYLDGELGASRAGEVAAHIADCAACSAVAADFCAISEKLADWTVAGPTDALTKVIGYVTQVARKADRPRTGVLSRVGQVMRGRPWKIATAFGALAALALVAVTFLQPMYMAKRVASSSSNTVCICIHQTRG